MENGIECRQCDLDESALIEVTWAYNEEGCDGVKRVIDADITSSYGGKGRPLKIETASREDMLRVRLRCANALDRLK